MLRLIKKKLLHIKKVYHLLKNHLEVIVVKKNKDEIREHGVIQIHNDHDHDHNDNNNRNRKEMKKKMNIIQKEQNIFLEQLKKQNRNRLKDLK